MLDEEIAACVAMATGGSPHGARIEPLGGKQGLLVCRVTLEDGSYVFKAVRESGRSELALTAWLARAIPGVTPPVLHYEEDARRDLYWLVTRDLGPARLADNPTIEGYLAVAETLAAVQSAVIADAEEFAVMGVRCVGPAQWDDIALRTLEAAQAEPMLRADLASIERMVWGLDPVIGDTLSLPMALVHGDLHAGNIALCPDAPHGVCLLDWGSAYLAAAPIGVEELLWPAARHLRIPADLARVGAAYYRAMTPLLGKPGRLERAAAACRLLLRLQLLEEALRGALHDDAGGVFSVVAAYRRLADAWKAWERLP